MEAPTPLQEGTRVRFTAHQLGVVESLDQPHFASEVVNEGDTGVYIGIHPSEELAGNGWHIVQVRVMGKKFFCPCHRFHFEVIA